MPIADSLGGIGEVHVGLDPIAEVWVGPDLVWTAVRPLHFEVVEITTAGTRTITIPAWCTHVAAILVGGGGSGGWSFGSSNGGGNGAGQVIDTPVTPGTTTLTVGAGGAAPSNMTGSSGNSGSATTLLGHTAAGGSGGASYGSTPAGEETVPTPTDLHLLMDGQTTFFIGPSGKSTGQAGQRGGGGASGNGPPSPPGAGGAGWARIWMWNRDPRT